MELKSYDNKSFSPEYTTYATIDLSVNENNNNNNQNHNNNSSDKCNIVVKLTNVSLTVGQCKVFSDLNLSVPSGKIYSILGPKKCGKTSLLHCITGLKQPSKGEVLVFGQKPASSGAVGYMPQGMPLFDNLTIKETLDYFGKLYDLPYDTINNKLELLINSIAINNSNAMIKTLTNQNKLIVSLAVSIIHSPKLLILDEPAKYGDPLSRKSMWAQMRGLCEKEGTTIVITVNHIEEARYADIVGLVSNGNVISKECSQRSLEEVSVNLLEDAFLNLFEDEKNSIVTQKPEQNDKFLINDKLNIVDEKTSNGVSLCPSPTELCATSVPSTSWQRISALSRKNFLITLRSWKILLIKLLIPALAVIFFCALIGKNPRNIPIGVYNPDKPSFASNLIITNIDNDALIVKKFNSLDSALNAIKDNSIWAVIAFPSNYTISLFSQSSQSCESTEEFDDIGDGDDDEEAEDSVKDLQKEKIHLKIMNANNWTNDKNESTGKLSMRETMKKETERETEENSNNDEREKEDHNHEDEDEEDEGDGKEEEGSDNEHNEDTTHGSDEDSDEHSREVNELEEEHRLSRAKPFTVVDLYLDNTNVLIGGFIKRQVLFAMKRAKNKSGELSRGRSSFPIRIMSPPIFGFDDAEMAEFITPGIVIAIIFFCSLLSTSFTIIAERNQRSLERDLVCGVKLREILLVHLLVQVVTLILQITLIMICVFHIFRFPLIGSVIYAFLLIFMQGLCGVAIGIAICSCVTGQNMALMLDMLVFSVALVIGNIFWPIECMPVIVQNLSPILPQTIATTALRSVLLRAWTLMNATVIFGLFIPTLWIVLLLLFSILVFKVKY